MKVGALDRTLSAWARDSESGHLLSSLQDAERVLKPVFNTNEYLEDPPRPIGEDGGEDGGEDDGEDGGEDGGEGSGEGTSCRTAAQHANTSQQRMAPSLHSIDRDTNTVEIVKKDGAYVLVLDGIAHQLSADEDSTTRFWLPRFKEEWLPDSEEKQAKRSVKPVLFSMRLEDFETPPSSCVVDTEQRIVEGGVLHMNHNTIKSTQIIPFAVNDASVKVTVLPYPLVCTEAPHFVLNDFSKVSDAEVRLKVDAESYDDKTWLSNSINKLKTVGVSLGKEAIRAIVSDLIRRVSENPLFYTGAGSFAAAQIKDQIKAQYDKLLETMDDATINKAIFLSTLTTLLASVYSIRYPSAPIAPKPKLTLEEKDVTRNQMVSAMEAGPVMYKIKIPELTSMLYRIAESRANGSMMTGTDHTLGMSIHDFRAKNWNREAALMFWLMNGEGNRPGRDQRTGLYDSKLDATHAIPFMTDEKKDIQKAELTLNTIGKHGMDPLTLSNCRTEFTYVIRIKEQDGSDGPTIILDATRINGIDAAWIASGFTEQFYECKKAAQCLRFRLHSLPRVSDYMVSSLSTLVSDTKNGDIVGRDMDADTMRKLEESPVYRILFGRDLEDENGVETNEDRRQKRVQKLRKMSDSANTKLGKYRTRITELERRLKKSRETDTIKRELAQTRKEMEICREQSAMLNNRANQADDTSDTPRVVASLFEPETTYARILTDILGPLAFDFYDGEDGEDGEDDDNEEAGSWFFRLFWGKARPGTDTDTEKREYHFINAREALASSYGVQADDIHLNSAALIRFVDMLCPFGSGPRDARRMRFAAFVVPPTPASSFYPTPPDADYYVRILPQFMVFSASLFSAYGSVSFIQPVTLSDKTFLTPSQSQKASNSVSQAKLALLNMTGSFDEQLQNMTVYKGTHCHFCQTYTRLVDKTYAEVGRVLHMPIKTQHKSLDMLSLAFVPSAKVVNDMILANEAGGSLLDSMKDLVSGSSHGGVASLLSGMGLQTNPYCFIALASFAEILAHYILEHGTSSPSTSPGVGFELQRYELVQSAFRSGLMAARTIGQFLLDTYASTHSKKRRFNTEDIAFYCIPGMIRLRVVLRRIGILGATRHEHSMTMCTHVGRALVKLGSTNKHVLSAFPFTCIQSSISAIPRAMRGLENYSSAVEMHLRAAKLAHERCFHACSLFAANNNNKTKAIVYVLVDLLYSRPVAAKAFQSDRAKAIRAVGGKSNKLSQAHWSPGAPPFQDKLRNRMRLSRLRLDVSTEQKEQRVLNSRLLTEDAERAVLIGLVDGMTKMTMKDLAYYDGNTPSATYMVPFGMTAAGSASDIMHTKFETHPVWLEHLLATATSTIISPHENATVNLVVKQNRPEKTRLNHPHAIKVTNHVLYATMYASMEISDADMKHYDESFESHLESLESLCARISDAPDVYSVSGVLSEHYKLTMHNAERAYQVCMVLASGATNHDASIQRLSAKVIMPDKDYNNPAFVASLCVGNAVALSECGSAARVVITDTGNGERETCAKIEEACKRLIALGVKAIPFSELCACLSLV